MHDERDAWTTLYREANREQELVMPTDPLPFVEEITDRLVSAGHERVLEAAAGEGRNSQLFVDRIAEPHACDISEQALERCQSRCSGAITTQVDDVRALSYEGERFDATVLLDALTHLRPVELVLRELVRVTREGGNVIFNLPVAGDEAVDQSTLVRDYGIFEEYEYTNGDHTVVYMVLTNIDGFAGLLRSFGLSVRDIERELWRDPPHPPYRLRAHDHENLVFYTQRTC